MIEIFPVRHFPFGIP